MEKPLRATPPRQDCADHDDCFADPTEIGHVCVYGPICGTCVVYRPFEIENGLLSGSCRLRPDRGTFACNAPICGSYIPRQGAPNAKGETATARERVVALGGGKTASKSRRSTSAQEKPARARIPDGPVGELEMTREELKELIREAMDEERGASDVPLAPKWEGGTLVVKPANEELQAKEFAVDTLFHKIVMVRDRLRVLEAKLNAHPTLSPAEKVEMQGYVTKCYGSLTTFNVLFRDKDDQFSSSGSS